MVLLQQIVSYSLKDVTASTLQITDFLMMSAQLVLANELLDFVGVVRKELP